MDKTQLNKQQKQWLRSSLEKIEEGLNEIKDEQEFLINMRNKFTREENLITYDNLTLIIENFQSFINDVESSVESFKRKENL